MFSPVVRRELSHLFPGAQVPLFPGSKKLGAGPVRAYGLSVSPRGSPVALFDFLKALPRYRAKPGGIRRLDRRQRFIIEPHLKDIRGARVLDLGSHDGRWPYAFSVAGAREVIGIEGRAELIAEFATYPKGPEKDRVTLRQRDINEEVPRLAAEGARFDVVAILGLFYHITTHYTLLSQIRALQPKLILIDGMFMNDAAPVIRLVPEDPARPMNTLPVYDCQEVTLKGVPSRTATDLMAKNLGYRCDWLDWGELSLAERRDVPDYFQDGDRCRATCALRPVNEGER